jgi:hypothetical protein
MLFVHGKAEVETLWLDTEKERWGQVDILATLHKSTSN